MKAPNQFIQAITNLLWSWGGDTPPEAIWSANELIDWVEKEFNVVVTLRFEENPEDLDPDDVLKELRRVL